MSWLSVKQLPDLQDGKNREKSNLGLCGVIKLLAFRTSGLDLEAISSLHLDGDFAIEEFERARESKKEI